LISSGDSAASCCYFCSIISKSSFLSSSMFDFSEF